MLESDRFDGEKVAPRMAEAFEKGMAARSANLNSTVAQIAAKSAGRPDRLLEVLHEIHDDVGYLDPSEIPTVAAALNISQADIVGVVSFYGDFRTTPPPAHQVQICRGEACQAGGAEKLAADARELISDDVEVRPVFCLGNCALGPAAMVDGVLMAGASMDTIRKHLGQSRVSS